MTKQQVTKTDVTDDQGNVVAQVTLDECDPANEDGAYIDNDENQMRFHDDTCQYAQRMTIPDGRTVKVMWEFSKDEMDEVGESGGDEGVLPWDDDHVISITLDD